ncbi:MAG: hypothetical protein KDD60_10240, partial [Bdellovibrionales bacterium]|nr:hypothetical protein [Bdellovibrionales bacterium]
MSFTDNTASEIAMTLESNDLDVEEGEGVSITSLMAEIRKRTEAEVLDNADKRLTFQTHQGNFHAKRKAGEILHSSELRFLNEHYHYPGVGDLGFIRSHRGGVAGKIIEKVKRKFANFLANGILREYFEKEKNF